MLEYVEPVETLCANVVDFGILDIFCFEVYVLLGGGQLEHGPVILYILSSILTTTGGPPRSSFFNPPCLPLSLRARGAPPLLDPPGAPPLPSSLPSHGAPPLLPPMPYRPGRYAPPLLPPHSRGAVRRGRASLRPTPDGGEAGERRRGSSRGQRRGLELGHGGEAEALAGCGG